MPERRIAWACSFGCGRNVTTKRKSMESHEARCFHNPATRSCATCDYDRIADDDNGVPEGEPYSHAWENKYCEKELRGEAIGITRCEGWMLRERPRSADEEWWKEYRKKANR
jgi:hypothetical protein